MLAQRRREAESLQGCVRGSAGKVPRGGAPPRGARLEGVNSQPWVARLWEPLGEGCAPWRRSALLGSAWGKGRAAARLCSVAAVPLSEERGVEAARQVKAGEDQRHAVGLGLWWVRGCGDEGSSRC
jgi:hypothetical protein